MGGYYTPPTRRELREADRARRHAVVTTGRMPELLQDCDRKLSLWFATRPNARYEVREVCVKIFMRST